MRRDREIALKLRLEGKSYGEINGVLGIPKATLSGWFSHLVLSTKAQGRIKQRHREKSFAGLLKRNKNQTRLALIRAREARASGAKVVANLSRRDIFILGAALYWAEGYKRPVERNGHELTQHPVSLTNSDPSLVKIFLRFLREWCRVPEDTIKADIRIFQHQNSEELLHFWQGVTRIQPENFGAVYYGVSKSSLGKRPFNRLPYGVVQIRISNTSLFHTIIGYIEGLKRFV